MKTVVFMGTPDFAVPALKALIASDCYKVELVLSKPDKPQGRKQLLTPSPVKRTALENNIEVFQPATLKNDDVYEKISGIAPDFIVVAAYGKILPKKILDIPRFGCINLHGSLLPKYRGAAPIQWSVINGERETGVTSMLMDAGMDTGNILFSRKKKIGENETAGEVFEALAEICPELLIKTLEAIENNTVTPLKQNEEEATYVSTISKEMSFIDWNLPAQTVHNLIRGMNPQPAARTSFKGRLLKIYGSLVCAKKTELPPGSVITENDNIFVACGSSSLLRLVELQLEGSKRMSSADFLRGHSFGKNFSFLSED